MHAHTVTRKGQGWYRWLPDDLEEHYGQSRREFPRCFIRKRAPFDAMAFTAVRTEKAYEKHAWVIFIPLQVLVIFFGLSSSLRRLTWVECARAFSSRRCLADRPNLGCLRNCDAADSFEVVSSCSCLGVVWTLDRAHLFCSPVP